MGSTLTEWKVKALAQWNTINNMAVRRFGEGALAEEAAIAVMDGLQADNWRRLRAYKGKASFVTFVRTLTTRLLEDFARKRFGRVRPPLWVKSFGGFWEKLFRALCLERLKVEDAVEVVLQRQMTASKKEIENAAYHLLARIPDCGIGQGMEIAFEEIEQSWEDSAGDPGQSVEERQITEMFGAVFQLVLGEKKSKGSDSLLKKFKQLRVRLSPDEKILLKLCYQDGFGVTQAGKILGMSRFQAHGRMRRLMTRLKEEFERVGLSQELLLLLK